MPRLKTLTRILATLAVCLAPALNSVAKVLVPIDKALVKQNSIVVVGTAPKGSEVEWSARGAFRSEKGITKVDFGEIFEIFLLLEPGLNALTVGQQTLEVFYDTGATPPPKEFGLERLHAGDVSRCEDCHDTVTRKLLDGGYPEACLGCHVVESQNPKNPANPRKDKHFQTAVSQCGTCHFPHVSKTPKLLTKDTISLCGQCHAAQVSGAGSHPAYDDGGCTACHDAHYSGFPKGLKEPQPAVCHKCHEQGAGIASTAQHTGLSQERSCGLCHDPHGSKTSKLLRPKAGDLCLACHPKVLSAGHGAELSSCPTCHDPHLAKGSGLLKGPVADACGACHQAVAKGKTVHKAVQKGCQACHVPHSDQNLAEAQRSCFKCHDLKKNRELASLHGDLDLAVESCAKCHPAHASNEEKLVLAKLHYPLTQGKCSVCHGGGDDRSLKVDRPAARCRLCHTLEKAAQERGERLHEPVASGECTTCHDPHMAKTKGLLLKSAAETCRQCHDDPTAGKSVIHGALAKGCQSCHAPHASKNGKLLKLSGNALCKTCHTVSKDHHTLDIERASAYPKAEKFAKDGKEFECLGCHAPHASVEKKLLVRPAKELCISCHEEM